MRTNCLTKRTTVREASFRSYLYYYTKMKDNIKMYKIPHYTANINLFFLLSVNAVTEIIFLLLLKW